MFWITSLYRQWSDGQGIEPPVVVVTPTQTPAGSAKRRGRPPHNYFVEWRGKLYKVAGEREGLSLLKRLRDEDVARIKRQAPVLARRAAKQDSPPPLHPPLIYTPPEAPESVAREAGRIEKELAALYSIEASAHFVSALKEAKDKAKDRVAELEARVSRLEDDMEVMWALIND